MVSKRKRSRASLRAMARSASARASASLVIIVSVGAAARPQHEVARLGLEAVDPGDVDALDAARGLDAERADLFVVGGLGEREGEPVLVGHGGAGIPGCVIESPCRAIDLARRGRIVAQPRGKMSKRTRHPRAESSSTSPRAFASGQ